MSSARSRFTVVVAIVATLSAIGFARSLADSPTGLQDRVTHAPSVHPDAATGAGSDDGPAFGGDIDPTFGEDGKVTTNIGSDEELRAVAVDAHERIVTAGCVGGHGHDSIALARYRPDGILDHTFGDDGIVTTNLSDRGGDCALDLAIQTDGRIVVAGHAGFGSPRGTFALVRYGPDGALDTTFGGDGSIRTDFTPQTDYASAIAIQADGKIVAAGQSGLFGPNTMFAVARYESDGSLDRTFGERGMIETDFTSGDDQANAIALQADARIVVAGGAGMDRGARGTGFALARYEADGTLDPTFGQGGRVTTQTTLGRGDFAEAVEILPDGGILAGGRDALGGCEPCGSDMSTSFEVIRYNADGTLDRTFGYRGMVTTRFSAKDDSASDLAVDAEGRIVVAGVAGQGRGGRGDSWFALARYESDGTLDRTFGKTKADFSHNTDGAIAVVLQADGRIVLAGTADYLGPHDAFALAGFLS